MILKRQNMSENKWNHFKIVPQGHNNCQLSIVNCQFGEAAKFQFAYSPRIRGMDMQRGPPRPRDSSAEGIRRRLTPALSRISLVTLFRS